MSDQAKSDTPPVDWTDDGIYRAVFLALFGPEDRAALQRSGIIFATQAVSGDTADDPVFDNLRADVEDLRMASRHLLEVSRVRHGSKVSDREHELCQEAEAWSREAEDLAYTIEGWLEAAP